jgi:hypothetical protein
MRKRAYRHFLPAAAFAMLLLTACAGTPAKGGQERAGRAYAGRNLAVILPDSAQIDVRNPGDLAVAFPREKPSAAAAVLAQEFGEAFYSGLAPALDYVVPGKVPDSVPVAPPDQRVTAMGRATFALPAHAYSAPKREWLRAHGVEADLALVVGPLTSSVVREDIVAPKFGGALKVTSLALEGWFVIWDYAADRAIAQGRFRPAIEYKREPGTRDWLKAFDKAVETVGEASPFKGPKWYRR